MRNRPPYCKINYELRIKLNNFCQNFIWYYIIHYKKKRCHKSIDKVHVFDIKKLSTFCRLGSFDNREQIIIQEHFVKFLINFFTKKLRDSNAFRSKLSLRFQ